MPWSLERPWKPKRMYLQNCTTWSGSEQCGITAQHCKSRESQGADWSYSANATYQISCGHARKGGDAVTIAGSSGFQKFVGASSWFDQKGGHRKTAASNDTLEGAIYEQRSAE
eukprot:691825-Karenia_brevis.AAC.1